MTSQYVCRRCGLSVHLCGRSDGSTYWKHSVAGQHGKTPKHMRHPANPMTRTAYLHAFAVDSDDLRAALRRLR